MDIWGKARRAELRQDMAAAAEQLGSAAEVGIVAFALVGAVACLALVLAAAALARTSSGRTRP